MQTFFVFFFIIIGICFGAWNKWREIYPTLLFWIIGNLLYEVLLYNYRVWVFKPVGVDNFLLPTHSVISLAIAFIVYPFVSVVYLGRFPNTLLKKILWIILWSLIFQGAEIILYNFKSITHHFGWSLLWSFIFNLLTFLLLAIHQWKPWVAWLFSIIFIILLIILFQPPIPA
ncbi:CBO0543 family protein [Bacillus sp. 7894-2]|uniref:CBO0543 family protein n=1 Tax=Bacillus sp. 7894-2 TaxID=2021695 RepID=UPI000BA5CB95|nr:CBO0543 family protein [Bacillus sp. 7894-2]PAE23843.1 hypothetical protein CHI10_15470 [Bacillus sp. 7894-2]